MNHSTLPVLSDRPDADFADNETFLPAALVECAWLTELAAGAGILPQRRNVLCCGVGIPASLGLLALHLAGFPDRALYDASWREWGADPTRPLERSR